MRSTLSPIKQLVQLKIAHGVVSQGVRFDVLHEFLAILILLRQAEEVLNAVQPFVVVEHMHEIMLVLG